VTRPLISVCILAYNRAALLPALLEGVLAQDTTFTDWECIVSEDASPERDAIRAVVEEFARRAPPNSEGQSRFRYHQNARTLGYDGNFRQLVALAKGRYVFMMGNDDLVAAGALRTVADALARHGEIGGILRAYDFFRDDPARPIQTNRYYARETRFPAGERAIVATFRRFVVVSGLVLNRDAAHALATDQWDGTLFYQQWLAGNIFATMDAVYLPSILAHFRRGGSPDFGNAEAEKGRFTPGVQPLDTQLKMVRAILDIAEGVERAQGIPIARVLTDDFARYSYHTLLTVAPLPFGEYWRAYRAFGAMGFDRSPWFHLWFWLLAVIGARGMERIIQTLRGVIGHTPNLSREARAPTT
jgi:glycosyltransferase involved in cell wall biosynthesis